MLTACAGNDIKDNPSISEAKKEKCFVSDANIRGVYKGSCLNGKANGYGSSKGKPYNGHYYQLYEGYFKDGFKEGEGTQTWFKQNGDLTWSETDKYVGQFKNDKQDGQGTETLSDGRKYTGQFRDGNYYGQGTSIDRNGRKYVGQFKDGKPVDEAEKKYRKQAVDRAMERIYANRKESDRIAKRRTNKRRADNTKERNLRRLVDAKKRALFNSVIQGNKRTYSNNNSSIILNEEKQREFTGLSIPSKPRLTGESKNYPSPPTDGSNSFKYPVFEAVEPKRRPSSRDPNFVPEPEYIPMPKGKRLTDEREDKSPCEGRRGTHGCGGVRKI